MENFNNKGLQIYWICISAKALVSPMLHVKLVKNYRLKVSFLSLAAAYIVRDFYASIFSADSVMRSIDIAANLLKKFRHKILKKGSQHFVALINNKNCSLVLYKNLFQIFTYQLFYFKIST